VAGRVGADSGVMADEQDLLQACLDIEAVLAVFK
jgi:hypothetical protein